MIFIIFCNCIFSKLPAQTIIEREVAKAVKYVERNLSATDKEVAVSDVEFFVYDISCDSSGNVLSVQLLVLDTLTSRYNAKIVGDKIKLKYKFGPTGYKKIYLPVLIINTGIEVQNTEISATVAETASFFEKLSSLKLESVFIARQAVIMSMANKKK